MSALRRPQEEAPESTPRRGAYRQCSPAPRCSGGQLVRRCLKHLRSPAHLWTGLSQPWRLIRFWCLPRNCGARMVIKATSQIMSDAGSGYMQTCLHPCSISPLAALLLKHGVLGVCRHAEVLNSASRHSRLAGPTSCCQETALPVGSSNSRVAQAQQNLLDRAHLQRPAAG